jgi:hypothetical protein
VSSLGAAALALALSLSACFHVQHELPSGTFFGTLPRMEEAPGAPFEQAAMKNWFLAGLFAYTSFDAGDLIQPPEPGRYVKLEQIETVFSPWDVVISVVPGYFYGYYVFAPRTMRVRGQVVETRAASR